MSKEGDKRHTTAGPHELQRQRDRERGTHQDNLISCNFNIGRPGSCPTVNTSYISIEKEKKRAFVIGRGRSGCARGVAEVEQRQLDSGQR